MRIAIFGDSIAHGYWDAHGGWVQRARTQYDKQSMQHLGGEFPDVYNLSIAGDTAQSVVKRLAFEMKSRQLPEEPIIVIAIGMNDTLIFEGVETNSIEMFTGELQQILAAARQFTPKMLFVGLSAVDDKLCNPWKPGGGNYCFNNDRIWEFEKAIRSFCKEHELQHIKVFESFQGKRIEENLLADGLHPNEAGHQLIAELVKPALDKFIKAS